MARQRTGGGHSNDPNESNDSPEKVEEDSKQAAYTAQGLNAPERKDAERPLAPEAPAYTELGLNAPRVDPGSTGALAATGALPGEGSAPAPQQGQLKVRVNAIVIGSDGTPVQPGERTMSYDEAMALVKQGVAVVIP